MIRHAYRIFNDGAIVFPVYGAASGSIPSGSMARPYHSRFQIRADGVFVFPAYDTVGGAAPPPAAGTLARRFHSRLRVYNSQFDNFIVFDAYGVEEAVTPPTGQGEQASAPAGIVRRRRHYVFPDGTRVMATEDEVRELLAEYLRMRVTAESRKEGGRSRVKVVRVPPLELERIEWKQAADTAEELLVAKLPNRILWKPEPKQFAKDVARLRRRIDDEEAIIALLT